MGERGKVCIYVYDVYTYTHRICRCSMFPLQLKAYPFTKDCWKAGVLTGHQVVSGAKPCTLLGTVLKVHGVQVRNLSKQEGSGWFSCLFLGLP